MPWPEFGSPFAANALSFAVVLVVLFGWKREASESSRGLTFGGALKEGILFVRDHSTMKHVLLGVVLFLLPATALWSLLPLIAREQLGWQAEGYGLLVTSLGMGAVVAARMLHWLHRRVGVDQTIALAMGAFAVGLAALASTTNGWLALPVSFLMGAAWMLTLTTLNATAQMSLPNELRARGMGCYMTVMAMGMSAGAFAWGQIAGQVGLAATQWIAAATMLLMAATSLAFRLDGPPREVGDL